ncbi:MAG TPA: ATP-binding cassette domain-containing protein [Streptosporangiaceae bacterium]|nr:ATP-binding cassette domain-containing protein [Streptosporangiaceae bacterium]
MIAPAHERVLTVTGLVKKFTERRPLGQRLRGVPARVQTAVDDISFYLDRGEVLGIAGESGSGKSTTARCITRLVEPDAGHVIFDGLDVRSLRGEGLREVRRRIQMVFQDPYASLNPRMTVGSAILEAGRVHHRLGDARPAEFVARQLDLVKLPGSYASRRPRELSGGQRQRIAIARALATGPEIIIADEAVSALDVSIQTEIVNLFLDLRDELAVSLIFVSHQLPVLASIANRVAIMHAGAIVETGPTSTVFESPQHSYTVDLLAAHPRPRFEQAARQQKGQQA